MEAQWWVWTFMGVIWLDSRVLEDSGKVEMKENRLCGFQMNMWLLLQWWSQQTLNPSEELEQCVPTRIEKIPVPRELCTNNYRRVILVSLSAYDRFDPI